MLRKTALSLLFCILLLAPAVAQNLPVKKVFLNNKWQETDSASAKYRRIIAYKDTARYRAEITEYELPNQLLSREQVVYNKPTTYTRDGEHIEYYKTGQLLSQGAYKMGKLNGQLKTYYANGQLRRDDVYDNGELVTGKCFTATGQDTAHFIFEKPAEYPGGEPALYQFISRNIKYPNKARKRNEEGRVMVSFIVEKDGSIKEIELFSGATELLNAEALRVVHMLDGFEPAIQEGRKVRYRYLLPVKFKLQ